jgi:hypothetical protein
MALTDAEIQEALLSLYLRLNGYFVTSFIVHAPELGKNVTQLDAVAVRLSFNREPERVMLPSPFLELKKGTTDLLICEVKSRGQALQFNQSFRGNDRAITSVVEWAGLFDEEEAAAVVRDLKPLLQPETPRAKAKTGVAGPRGTRVRPLFASPERHRSHDNQPWFLPGSEIFCYVGECLNPVVGRPTCSTRYDLNLWGTWLAPCVRYFKEARQPGEPGRMNDLYNYLREHR